MSMSVIASSSTSSGPVSTASSCSSEGNSKRGLMALLVSGLCAAAPACRLSARWPTSSLVSEAAADEERSRSGSEKRRKIFLPRLPLVLASAHVNR